jgi:hypothetical protein
MPSVITAATASSDSWGGDASEGDFPPRSPTSATSRIRELMASKFAASFMSVAAFVATGLAIVGITISGMAAVFAYSPSLRDVDRSTCDCTCWDGAFKNGYKTEGYRTMYFSFDSRLQTLLLWVATFFLLAQCLVRHMVRSYWAGEARIPMLCVLACQMYSHHYSMWAGFNYINEGYIGFMAVQVIFAFTEILSTVAGAAQLSRDVPLAPRALWVMVGVSAFHAWHNVIDWTSGKIGMPLMLAADLSQGAVALWYIAQTVGTQVTPWFAPSPRPRKREPDAEKATASPTSFGGSPQSSRSSTVYTTHAAGLDAGGTVVAVIGACFLLNVWQSMANLFERLV